MTAVCVWNAANAIPSGAAAPTVSPRADGDTNLLSDFAPVTCHQGCDFDIDGDEWENTNWNIQTNTTVWLDSGSSDDVWVEFVRTAGATNWDSHTSSVRYQINVNQRFGLSVSRSSPGTSSKEITGYFRMWDAASGGSILWTGSTVLWKATATYQSGPCSTC